MVEDSVSSFNCYYCGGTGYVPFLHEPDESSSVYHIKEMACKCSRGERVSMPFKRFPGDNKPLLVRKYFSENDSLQFMERVDGVGYPLLVSNKRNLLNKELKDDRKNSKQGDIN
jgi:hypothetical protein|tara:strand:- start:365 stop:706 length:342 start_codon:yes stop_codon:yes gene_type:complete